MSSRGKGKGRTKRRLRPNTSSGRSNVSLSRDTVERSARLRNRKRGLIAAIDTDLELDDSTEFDDMIGANDDEAAIGDSLLSFDDEESEYSPSEDSSAKTSTKTKSSKKKNDKKKATVKSKKKKSAKSKGKSKSSSKSKSSEAKRSQAAAGALAQLSEATATDIKAGADNESKKKWRDSSIEAVDKAFSDCLKIDDLDSKVPIEFGLGERTVKYVFANHYPNGRPLTQLKAIVSTAQNKLKERRKQKPKKRRKSVWDSEKRISLLDTFQKFLDRKMAAVTLATSAADVIGAKASTVPAPESVPTIFPLSQESNASKSASPEKAASECAHGARRKRSQKAKESVSVETSAFSSSSGGIAAMANSLDGLTSAWNREPGELDDEFADFILDIDDYPLQRQVEELVKQPTTRSLLRRMSKKEWTPETKTRKMRQFCERNLKNM